MPRARRVAIAMLLAICVGGGDRPSRADGPPIPRADARQHYESGERLYNVKEYEKALEEFTQAYLAFADPALLFNIAQCHRMLGNKADAVTYYVRYLTARPSTPDRAFVERTIEQLKAAPTAPVASEARDGATSPAAAEASISSGAPNRTPPAFGSVTGTQTSEATLPLPDASRSAPNDSRSTVPGWGPELAPRSPVAPIASGQASPPAPPPALSEMPRIVESPSSASTAVAYPRLRLAGTIVGASGIAAAAVGGVLWRSADRAYNDCQHMHGCTLASEPRGRDTAGVVLFWTGVGLMSIGTAAFAVLHASSPARLAWLDHVAVQPGGSLLLRSTF